LGGEEIRRCPRIDETDLSGIGRADTHQGRRQGRYKLTRPMTDHDTDLHEIRRTGTLPASYWAALP
jgi:hypothetical protein